jgi:hypothetical protein
MYIDLSLIDLFFCFEIIVIRITNLINFSTRNLVQTRTTSEWREQMATVYFICTI